MTILRVFAPFAFGYFLSYLFRAVNAVIAPDLVSEMGLSAADLGLLSSTYFLTFAAVQLPLGILLDRFGPRRTESVLLLFAAGGAFVFAMAPNTGTLILGRGLIGFGVSACLMAAFKGFVQWLPSERLPLANGLLMATGGLGALAATVPVEQALTVTDWRGVFLALGVLTVLATALLFLVVPERDDGPSAHGTLAEQVRGIAQVMTSPLFWRVAPLTFTTQATFISLQSLWSGPWLRDVAGLDRDGVALGLLAIAMGLTTGYVAVGTIADRLVRLRIGPVAVALVAMTFSIVIQCVLALQLPVPPILVWSLFALFGTSGVLVYAALSQAFPKHLAGRVNTSINLLVFVASFVFQWGIGAVIDLWPATASGGYEPEAYRAGFGTVLGIEIAAMLWLIFFRRAPLPIKA